MKDRAEQLKKSILELQDTQLKAIEKMANGQRLEATLIAIILGLSFAGIIILSTL